MTGARLAIKVDADTWMGTREGLPRLRDIFEARGIKASFFLSLGPDNSGRAALRVFTRPGFMSKMIRTRAPGAYGWRTLFFGTLLPAPIIAQGQGAVVRGLIESGHEVGLHAWDHVTWHDRLWKMTPGRIRAELKRGLEAFSALTGQPPRSFAAPAWRINLPAAVTLEKAGLVYMSATRGRCPYRPSFLGHALNLLEIPTTLPTADEILGRNGLKPDHLSVFFLGRITRPGLHVLTVHAEMEGRSLAPAFERLLDRCLDQDVALVRLIDVAHEILARPEDIPAAEVIRAMLPGRPGRVSYQAP